MARSSKYVKVRRAITWAKIAILTRDAWRCCYCGYNGSQARHKMSVDHILPKSRGGDDSPENLCACCLSCNGQKAGRTVAEWRAGIARRYCVGKPLSDVEIERMKEMRHRRLTRAPTPRLGGANEVEHHRGST